MSDVRGGDGISGQLTQERADAGGETVYTVAREQRLAAVFVELADTLVQGFDVIEFLYTVVERCVELLDVSTVGLMLGDDRNRLRVVASSTEETRLLELFQLQNDEGPCLECYRSGQPVDGGDLSAATERWPLFAAEAARAGFHSVHALPMRLREQTVGSLNLFHDRVGTMPDSATRIAQSLVDVATIGLIQAEAGRRQDILITQLQTALDTRVIIEQAKGVIAERHAITPAEAFGLLRGHARNHNQRLTELANAVVDRDPLAAPLLGGPPAASTASSSPATAAD